MSKARFIRISGWALILGAASLLLGIFASSAVSEASSQYDARYRSTDPFFEMVSTFLFPSAVVLITVGMAGLYARYAKESLRLGRGGLILGVMGGVAGFAAMLGVFIFNIEPLWIVMMYCLAAMFGGLVLFGVDTLRNQALTHRAYLPILGGIGFPSFIIVSGIYEAATGNWLEISDLVTLTIFGITSVALLGLGQILRGETIEEALPA